MTNEAFDPIFKYFMTFNNTLAQFYETEIQSPLYRNNKSGEMDVTNLVIYYNSRCKKKYRVSRNGWDKRRWVGSFSTREEAGNFVYGEERPIREVSSSLSPRS
jgi:hypothetical protein